ncbi:helix-turn-helix domain-containing protein [Gottfriedia sp. NPDC057948]|uniref:helix-turn-helix domain-containing protein n=1 Tax=Gottfriedia sp. NPDC057948 TaxID=3346287 RepID=UPI0036D83BE0
MYEGIIIKFYREKYNITQDQLSHGICSRAQICRIENDQVNQSTEIIKKLTERLGIDLESEVTKLNKLKTSLDRLHAAIIMQASDEINASKEDLEKIELITISPYKYFYQLLQIRILLLNNNFNEATTIIKKIQKIKHKLSLYEGNMLNHILGILSLTNKDYQNAIQLLTSIQDDIYKNPEYFYHLAIAYHETESSLLAYYFAEKAQRYFQQVNNYHRAIDSELLMIIQFKDVAGEEIINRYKNLINSCELCNLPERKSIIYYYLATEHFRRKNYELAKKYYKESMIINEANPRSLQYIMSLEGYVQNSFESDFILNL